MSDAYNPAPIFDDIVDADGAPSMRIDRDADALLARSEGRSYAPVESVRQAVHEDIRDGRAWARQRAERTRSAIQDQPMRTTLYAVGTGILIGLLLRR